MKCHYYNNIGLLLKLVLIKRENTLCQDCTNIMETPQLARIANIVTISIYSPICTQYKLFLQNVNVFSDNFIANLCLRLAKCIHFNVGAFISPNIGQFEWLLSKIQVIQNILPDCLATKFRLNLFNGCFIWKRVSDKDKQKIR